MPNKPPHPCAHAGCPELTRDQYCPAHAKLDARNYNRYQHDPGHAKRYGGDWRKIRAAYLSGHPLCEHCHAEGKLTPAALVHHKRPLTQGGNHDPANLAALCQLCHSAHHAREGDRWGKT